MGSATMKSRGDRYQGVEKESFAYKMMGKLGWQEGRGLGANEQGIKSHIKAKKKDDNLTVPKLTRKFLGGDAECVCGRLWWRSAGCNDVHLTCVAVCAVSCAVVWARAFCVCVCVSVRMPRSSRTPLAPPSRTSCPVSRSTSS